MALRAGCCRDCASGLETNDAATPASMQTATNDLEDMFKPQKRNEPFFAERQIETADKGAVAVKTEPDSVADVHAAERQVFTSGRHSAGIDEERTVECPPCFPAILRTEQQAIQIAITELPEAAQIVGAAECWLQ